MTRETPSIPLQQETDVHSSIIAPSAIEKTPGAIRAGNRWLKTQWIGEFADAPADGLLEALYSTGETRQTDISMHLDPRDTQTTLDSLENQLEDLEAESEYLSEKHRASARGIQKNLEDHRELYDILRNTSMRAFDVSMYLTTGAAERDELETDAVRKATRRAPANLTPVTPRWAQTESLVSASPISVDKLDESLDAKTPMLAGAVGAMFPFVSGSFAEPGVEYATYTLNESPLILDRFNRETGYCTMVIGQLERGNPSRRSCNCSGGRCTIRRR